MKLKRTGLAASFTALIVSGVMGAALTPAAYAYDETSTAAINVEKNHVILKGHDVVAYFSNQVVAGDSKYASDYQGATYLFSSESNKKAFDANPGHFAPQFGGFCAMGVALGKKLDVDPTQFVVHDDKLYLNVNADVFKVFNQDLPAM